MKQRLLNLGCGYRIHEDWVNVDFVKTLPTVIAADLGKGIPFPDESFDVVYHSHVLEHFSKQDGVKLLQECFRVLKPNGRIRVAIPDLEQLARQYLLFLENVRTANSAENVANYEWAVIEMIDQMVRESSGGEMLAFWQKKHKVNEGLVEKRMGSEYRNWRYHNQQENLQDHSHARAVGQNWVAVIKRGLRKYKRYWQQSAQPPAFSETGEKHKWMYDSYSLTKLLQQTGFIEVLQKDAFTSMIPGWEIYNVLDVESGEIRKPDSIFLEAIKKP